MAALYDADYARRYRTRDEELDGVSSYHALVQWVGEVCDRFDHPIDVLDLGCGTGRYFWGVRNARTLTGIDASEPMLKEASRPTHTERITAEHPVVDGEAEGARGRRQGADPLGGARARVGVAGRARGCRRCAPA